MAFMSNFALAKDLDSLENLLKHQPDNEELVFEWFHENWLQDNYKLVDSLAPEYLTKSHFSDSFKTKLRYTHAYSRLMLRYPIHQVVSQFRQVYSNLNHMGGNKQKGKVCHMLGSLYSNLDQRDSSELFYLEALQYYGKLKNKADYYAIISDLSIVYLKNGDAGKALETLNSIRKEAPKNLRCRHLEGYWGNYTYVFNSISLMDSAIHYSLKSIETASTCGEKDRLGFQYSNLSNVFSNVFKHEEARKYGLLGLHYMKQSSNSEWSAGPHVALERAYRGLYMIDSAIWHGKEAIKTKNHRYLHIAYGNLGIAYLMKEEFDSCIHYVEHSLVEKRRTKAIKGISECFESLAQAYREKGDLVTCKSLLDSSLFWQKKERPDYRQRAGYQRILGVYHIVAGNKEEAIDAFEAEYLYRDSVITSESNARIDGLRVVYEVEKKQARIKALDQENAIKDLKIGEQEARSNLMRIIIISVVVLSLLLLLGFVLQRRYALKLKSFNQELEGKKAVIESKNQQLDLVNKEIYHRTKNHMQTIASVMGLQKEQLTEGKAKEVLSENEIRLNAMGLMHKKLFKRDPFANVSLQQFSEELIDDLAYTFGVEDDLKHEVELGEIDISPNSILPISLALNECFANAFKYAFRDNEAPILKITGSRSDEKTTITIKDNGPGFKSDFAQNTNGSFGIDLIKNMVLQLEGEVTFHSDNGAVVSMEFKRL